MSLNVGGIYVKARKGVTRERVVEVVQSYWTGLGARPYDGDPLAIRSLSLEETGILGFAVSEPAIGGPPDNPPWIALYDSERYRADAALARRLAEELKAPVVHYEMHGATDHAYARAYGPRAPKTPKGWEEIETFVGENFPYPFLYYHQLCEERCVELRKNFALFAFEGIPNRPGAAYTGPSNERQKRIQRDALAMELVGQRNANDLKKLLAGGTIWTSALFEVDRCDPAAERDRDFVLALSDVLLRHREGLTALAEASVRAGDRTLFRRTVEALEGKGAEWLQRRAFKLLGEERIREAFDLYDVALDFSDASLQVWNNACYAMAKLPASQMPSKERLEALLARAEGLGPKNPSIYDNLASLYLKIGDQERALVAVESAARYGYENLGRMSTDPEFRSLQREPRFMRIFEKKKISKADLSELTVTKIVHGKKCVILRPSLAMHFFFDRPLDRLGPEVAKMLQTYLAEIPAEALTHYRTPSDGLWKKLVKARVTRDLNGLRRPDQDTEYIGLHYGTSAEGEPGDYAFHFEGRVPEAKHRSSLVMAFPWQETQGDVEGFTGRFAKYAGMMSYDTGSAGLTFLTIDSNYDHGSDERNDIVPRFLGFEDHPNLEYSPGTAGGPHWLNLISDVLIASAGGEAALRKAAPGALLVKVPGGLLLRAAKRPPVGVATNPDDLGAMPDISRALRAVRYPWKYKTPNWPARLDDLPSTSYENEKRIEE